MSLQPDHPETDPVETQLNRLLAITDDDGQPPSSPPRQHQYYSAEESADRKKPPSDSGASVPTDMYSPAAAPECDTSAPCDASSVGIAPASPTRSSSPPSLPVGASPPGDRRSPAYSTTLKVLLSNNLAGSIIGRSGQSIADLQARSGCRIKLSQSGDTFPGTGERVCLIQGEGVVAVRGAVALVLDKVRDAKEGHGESQGDEKSHGEETTSAKQRTRSSTYVVKILVPSPACGMLIGRGGSNIKSISEASGARIQLAAKDEAAAVATSERVVTVAGDLHCCTACIDLILDSLHENPELARYANMTTSYSRAMSGLPVGAGGSGHHGHGHGRGPPHHGHGQAVGGSYLQQGLAGVGVVDGHGGTHGIRPPSGWSPFQGGLMVGGGDPILQVGGVGGPLPPGGNPFLVNGGGRGDVGGRPAVGDGGGLVAHPPNLHTVKLAILDGAIGALVGRGGSNISELQNYTGARIHVSQKGIFMPGTTDRIVTISGPIGACEQAQYLIKQKVLAHQHAQTANGRSIGEGKVKSGAAGGREGQHE